MQFSIQMPIQREELEEKIQEHTLYLGDFTEIFSMMRNGTHEKKDAFLSCYQQVELLTLVNLYDEHFEDNTYKELKEETEAMILRMKDYLRKKM